MSSLKYAFYNIETDQNVYIKILNNLACFMYYVGMQKIFDHIWSNEKLLTKKAEENI